MSQAPPLRLLFDADILIKLSILDCFLDCIEASGLTLGECATMRSMTRSAGVEHAAVRDQKAGVGPPSRRLFKTLRAIATIDRMSEDERQLSATINATSQRLGLQVDGGEALLISVSVFRGIPYLSTGDKKAVRCLPLLAQNIPALVAMRDRVVPLELLLLRLIRLRGLESVYDRLEAGKEREKVLLAIIANVGRDQRGFETALLARLAQLERDAAGYICC